MEKSGKVRGGFLSSTIGKSTVGKNTNTTNHAIATHENHSTMTFRKIRMPSVPATSTKQCSDLFYDVHSTFLRAELHEWLVGRLRGHLRPSWQNTRDSS